MGAHGPSEDSSGRIGHLGGLGCTRKQGEAGRLRAGRSGVPYTCGCRARNPPPHPPPSAPKPSHNPAPGASSPPQAVVPSFVRRWVYSLPELIQAKEAGEFQAREEALRAEAEAEARAVAAAAEARPGGPRRGRKRKRR